MKKIIPIILSSLALASCSNSLPVLGGPFIETGQSWQGLYTCAQGVTKLQYDILNVNGNEFTAVYHFNYANKYQGSYLTHGLISGNDISATPVKWLKKPKTDSQFSKWDMVSINGSYNVFTKQISGQIPERGCTNFTIEVK